VGKRGGGGSSFAMKNVRLDLIETFATREGGMRESCRRARAANGLEQPFVLLPALLKRSLGSFQATNSLIL